MIAGATSAGLTNLEGYTDFDIVWPWVRLPRLRPGTTAVLRVKNEARSLPFALPPLLRACDQVLLVDNQSSDNTAEVAMDVARRHQLAENLTTMTYPFPIARAGAEHLAQHARSVHSLTYFYNWCFAQVNTRFNWEWDGDMVLTPEGEVSLSDVGWQVGHVQAVVRIPRHALYVYDDSRAFLDLGLRNAEEWGFPTGPDFVYAKAYECEVRTTPLEVHRIRLPQGLCVELKFLDGQEFDHWTDPCSFASGRRTERMRREWEVFHALRDGSTPEGVVELVAPPHCHVVDHVVTTWLPHAPRPLRPPGSPSRSL